MKFFSWSVWTRSQPADAGVIFSEFGPFWGSGNYSSQCGIWQSKWSFVLAVQFRSVAIVLMLVPFLLSTVILNLF